MNGHTVAVGYVYLIHFESSVNGKRHYIGYADEFASRIAKHRASLGSDLTKAANSQCVHWVVARVWLGATHGDERQIKNISCKVTCPICRQKQKDIERYRKRGSSRLYASAKPSA